ACQFGCDSQKMVIPDLCLGPRVGEQQGALPFSDQWENLFSQAKTHMPGPGKVIKYIGQNGVNIDLLVELSPNERSGFSVSQQDGTGFLQISDRSRNPPNNQLRAYRFEAT